MEFGAQDVLVPLGYLVAGELDQPVAPGQIVGQHRVCIQGPIYAFDHQQLRRLALCTGGAAQRSPRLVGVLEKIVGPIHDFAARKSFPARLVHVLERLLHAQMADRRRRTAA